LFKGGSKVPQTYSETWDLDSIFAGGSDSKELRHHLDELEHRISLFREKLIRLDPEKPDKEQWTECLGDLDHLDSSFSEAWSFVSCLVAENTGDEKARLLRNRLTQTEAVIRSLHTLLESKLALIPEESWKRLLNEPEIRPVAFSLEEMRENAREKMSDELETLAGNLSVDGYHAWGQLYTNVISRILIPLEADGKRVFLSAGQAFNKMSHPDSGIRRKVFREWEKAWEREADLCAAILNHLAGFRLQLYRHRGWDDVLREPLKQNRMKPETLKAMWNAVNEGKSRLVKYLERKARILGLEKLDWCDLSAPLTGNETVYAYDEAARMIVEQFRQFSPEMADFAEQAFRNRWIEAENRPGKRTGGFCTPFPRSRQTRIFMTFSGTADNVMTLAHELGHAWHQRVMADLPSLAQKYAMNVAETASTFAEWLMTDAALHRAGSREEKARILDNRLQRAVSFFMDIHSRFLFETRFYEERKKGPVSAERLSSLMEEAQKEAFLNALGEYHPHFWASKLHFYNTRVPFYNFPYTFGYLFSTGIFARAREEGSSFAQKYARLLRDTGRMKVEELAAKHLDVDLTSMEFWKKSVEMILKDVDEFLEITS
jgi:oligoendopeptidase F